jgi:hypothetical protein
MLPISLNGTGVRGFSRNIRYSFLIAATFKNSPSARCVSVANHVCKDVAIFMKSITFLKHILLYYFLYCFSSRIFFGLFLCICTVFVFYLYLYASLIGACALSPSP